MQMCVGLICYFYSHIYIPLKGWKHLKKYLHLTSTSITSLPGLNQLGRKTNTENRVIQCKNARVSCRVMG